MYYLTCLQIKITDHEIKLLTAVDFPTFWGWKPGLPWGVVMNGDWFKLSF